MIKTIAKLILALNGNVQKGQIAAGFAWGLLLGLVPAGNFFWIILIVVSFFFKHNHASKLLVMALIKIFMPLISSLTDALGWEILHIESLQPLFTTLYNMPFVPFTRFNNTLVAGGLVGGIVLWLPVFFLVLVLVPLYRNTIAPKIGNAKIVKVIAKIIAKIPFVSQITKAVTHGN
ncbi:hypothetical protein AGMMS50268_36370 [Spirochaetia bacterium]|nr:hypothetical protein AGMMS49546_25600 [Spirochaetia bacterium]GHV93134.1 hypothetical protein AGMMS50268_36370 [Spirochaetia bacterium]